MTDRETLRALREARALLRRHGHRCDVSAADLIRWLHTETPYPNPSFEEIIRNPFFVVHELIEIGEVRRKGLRITKHVIPRHPVPINWAHLRAAEVEFEIAAEEGAWDHLRSRYRDLKAWCEDPLLTPAQARSYQTLRRETQRRLRGSGTAIA